MSEKTPHRRPATFKLDDPAVIVMSPDDTGRPARGNRACQAGSRSGTASRADRRAARAGTPRLSLGHVFWPRSADWCCWAWPRHRQYDRGFVLRAAKASVSLALGFAVVAALALTVVIGREAFGLMRLATIESCTFAPPRCCSATTVPRAGQSSTISSSLRTRTRNWRAPAPRWPGTPTTSSMAPT